ncbi:hypothetical protein MRX96_015102 [Rhipicephalus microplus]
MVACSTGRERHATAPVTKSRPPFQPTFRYDCGTRPPLEDDQSFLEDHRWYYGMVKKLHEAAVTSISDAVARRHRGCLERQDRTSWLRPLAWGSNPLLTKIARTEGWPSPDVEVTTRRQMHDDCVMGLP